MADFGAIAERMILQLFDRVDFRRNPGDVLSLSDNERTMMQHMWNNWVAANLTKRGVESFQLLFENHPETVEVFHFMKGNTVEQMQYNSEIFLHVHQVMVYITDVINHLDNIIEVVPKFRQLGGRHGQKPGGYKVPGTFFPWLGDAMKELMQKQGGWTEVHDKAWAAIFRFMTDQLVFGQKRYGGGSEPQEQTEQ